MKVQKNYTDNWFNRKLNEALNLSEDLDESHIRDILDDSFEYLGQYINLGLKLVYDFVKDKKSAKDLYNTMAPDLDGLEFDALEGLIFNALEGANENPYDDWTDHIRWSLVYRMPNEANDEVEGAYHLLNTDDEKLAALWCCLNTMSLEDMVADHAI